MIIVYTNNRAICELQYTNKPVIEVIYHWRYHGSEGNYFKIEDRIEAVLRLLYTRSKEAILKASPYCI